VPDHRPAAVAGRDQRVRDRRLERWHDTRLASRSVALPILVAMPLRTFRFGRTRTIAAVLVGLAFAAAAAGQGVRLQRVAATGEAAPGGGVFDRFGAESAPIVAPVNARGDVAFFATLGRGNSGEGLFRWSRGRLVAVAREGDRVGSVGTLAGFGRHPVPALGDDGTVVFAAAIAGGRAIEGLFIARNGTVRPVALTGAQAPGSAGVLAALDAPAINARGDIVFLAGLRRGRETVEAVLIASGGRLRKIVAQGDPAPSGGSFAAFGPPTIDRDGAVAFGAAIEGRSVPGGIFIWQADQLRMVLGAGDESPIGGIFAKFSERVGFADHGTVVFHGQIKGAPAAAGIFAIRDGRTRAVARLGDAAPGGGQYSNFGLWPVISERGAIAFTAAVDGGPSPVIAVRVAGNGPRRVVGVGDSVPGGARIESFSLLPVVSIGAAGEVSFAVAPTTAGAGPEGLFVATAEP